MIKQDRDANAYFSQQIHESLQSNSFYKYDSTVKEVTIDPNNMN